MDEDRTVIALYETEDAAERARNGLIGIGIPGAQVSISGEERAGSTADYRASEGEGFFAALKDLFLPDRDRYTYAEGVRRGAKMVSARVPGSMIDRAIAVLEREDPLDIDAGETEWHSPGWSDYGRPADHVEPPENLPRREAGRGSSRVRVYGR